ncbi:MAG: hypothetical protein V3R51_07095, partial [Gammaproteobacteria bacterium]
MSRILHWTTFALLLLASFPGCVRAPSKQPYMIAQAEQYQRRGVNAFEQGDYITAKSMFENALRMYESVDNASGIVRTNINLVETAIRTREYEEATLYLREARDIASRNRLAAYQARAILLESTIALLTVDPERAQQLLEPLLPQFRGDTVPGNPDEITLSAIANRTWIAFERQSGQPDLWVRRFTNALGTARPKDPNLQGRLLRFQAQLAGRNGDFDHAHELLNQALANYKATLSQPGISVTLLDSGRLYVKQSRWVEAREDLQRGTSVRIQSSDKKGAADGLEMLAEVERKLGNPSVAVSLEQWVAVIRQDGPVDWH